MIRVIKQLIVIASCFFMIWLVLDMFWSSLIGTSTLDTIASNRESISPDDFHLFFHITHIEESGLAELTLNGVKFPDDFQRGDCIDLGISVGPMQIIAPQQLIEICRPVPDGMVVIENTPEHFFQANGGEVSKVVELSPIQMSVLTVEPIYYYPWDIYQMDFYVALGKIFEVPSPFSGESIPLLEVDPSRMEQLAITARLNAPKWDEQVDVLNSERVFIQLQRPRSLRRSTSILFVALLVFIGLLVTRIDQTGSVLEVAAAIFLGLWGIQRIIVPDSLSGITMIDPIILTFYITIIFAVLFQLVIKPWWRKLSKSNANVVAPQSDIVKTNHTMPNNRYKTEYSDANRLNSGHFGNLLLLIGPLFFGFIAIILFYKRKA